MPMKDQELKGRWIAALESGQYKQGVGALRRDGYYCCLGVLCDVVDPRKWDDDTCGLWDNQGGDLPVKVAELAGIGMSEGYLINMNDGGEDFAAIAAWIKGNL